MINAWWLVLVVPVVFLAGALCGVWISYKSKKGQCFHHHHSTGESWIKGTLIDLGMNKMFSCSKCNRVWFP